MIKKLFSFGLLSMMLISAAFAQNKPNFVDFINQKHAWVDSVFNTLTPKQRIAQLFLVRAHTNLGQRYIDSVKQVIEKEQLGCLSRRSSSSCEYVQ